MVQAVKENGEGKKLTPAQRAQRFNSATREHMKMMPRASLSGGDTADFILPRARLLKQVRLLVEAEVNAEHDSETDFPVADFAPYNIFSNISVELNSDFTPFNVSGKQLAIYNLLRSKSDVLDVVNSGRGRTLVENDADTDGNDGADNKIRFTMDLPIALNERDPIGLILLQNPETTVKVSATLGTDMGVLTSGSDYTITLNSCYVTPLIETYSIPADRDIFPDISMLKLVQGQDQYIDGAGQQYVKLSTGNTYRKLAFYIEDSSGDGEADDDISGNIELLFNQADIPYSIDPKLLSAINQEQYGQPLPEGLFVFDFSYQGLTNYGGARDYIDTERLQEFWLGFEAAESGNVTVVKETLSRLKR